MYRTVFMGEVTHPENQNLPDLSRRELVTLTALCVPIIVIGLYPFFILGPMQTSVADVVNGLATTVAGR
jgi:NADH-quinone oxidoreductase subunit M